MTAFPMQELAHRFQVWSDNVATIKRRAASNAAHGMAHTSGLNQHTDLTRDEFRARYLGSPMTPQERTQHDPSPTTHQAASGLQQLIGRLARLRPSGRGMKQEPQHWRYENVTAPAAVDWRQHSPTVLGAIKDQHVNGTPCGSCWAFSAVSIMEIASAMATGECHFP